MSQQSGPTRFLAPSPSDVTVKDPNTRSRFSYTREFLLSLAELYIAELPREVHLSISRVFEDACILLPPPICDSDSRWHKSVAQLSTLKGLDNVNNLLHRSENPYWPPRHYKALPPSNRDNNDFHNNENETSGSSICTSQEKVKWERWRKERVRKPKEDQFLFNERIDSTALMTSGNLNNLDSKQLDASHRLSLIEGALRGPNNTRSFEAVQGIITNSTLNLSEKSVNHNDASKHLTSLLEKGIQLAESKACSNLDTGHPAITPTVMNDFESAREKTEKIEKTEASEYYLSPSAGDRLYHSMVDKCESSKVHGFKQADLISMKQNPLSLDVPIQQELELNDFCSLDRVSTSSSELDLPDEDSLIIFDEPFLMPDMENTVIGDSIPSPEGNQIKDDDEDDSSNLTCDMIKRLVESILNDDSSPAPLLDDYPQVHHKGGLNTSCHSLQPLQPFTHFCPNQDTAMDLSYFTSLTLDSFPSSTRYQPFPPPSHDKKRRLDYDASHAMFQQMMTSYPQKLNANSKQDCTMGYQDPNYVAKCRFYGTMNLFGMVLVVSFILHNGTIVFVYTLL
ncbi:uncharacterized protein G2W53_034055 [Senna tora]|uniref:Uncharacterized protein n=1 Tax=Senna tora TaxID=362788 RepID=A0A834WDF5_9FABA|nr:uncharacterized protein G2W53_034055 [Senna tora]